MRRMASRWGDPRPSATSARRGCGDPAAAAHAPPHRRGTGRTRRPSIGSLGGSAADVAVAERAEDRRRSGHAATSVGVGVADDDRGVGNGDAAEHDLLAGAERRGRRSRRRRGYRRGRGRVLASEARGRRRRCRRRVVSLTFAGVAGDGPDRSMPWPTGGGRRRGERVPPGRCFAALRVRASKAKP